MGGPRGLTAEKRFWRFVDRSAGPDGCWLWTGGTVTSGYGQFYVPAEDGSTRQVRAHRFAYELAHGPIPDGVVVRHGCDTPACVNERHLTDGSTWDNNHDAAIRGRSHIKWLSDDTVAQIKSELASGKRQSDVARQFNVTRYAVWAIAHGKRHKEASTNTHEATKKAMPLPAKESASPS